MTTHLTGPCWNRKQPSREPPPGARASRHKPPQASKLTNPSLTWKVSSKQPSDVFFYRHQLLIYSFRIVFRTLKLLFYSLTHIPPPPPPLLKKKWHRIGNLKLIIPFGMIKPNSITSFRRHFKRTENPKKLFDTIGLSCRSKDVLGEFDY